MLHDIANCKGAGVSRVFEISWVKGVPADFVEYAPLASPFGKYCPTPGGLGAGDVFIFFSLFPSLNAPAPTHTLNRLQYFGLRRRHTDAQAHTKCFSGILAAGSQGNC